MTTAPPVEPPLVDKAARPNRDGRWLLDGAVGSQDGEGRPVSGPVEVVVRDGVIAGLTPSGRAEQPATNGPVGPDGRRADDADGTGLVLLPLFVNAHDHGRGAGNVAAGMPDGPLEEWIADLRRHPPSSQEALVGGGCDLMVASGVGASVICVNPQSPDTRAEVVAAAEAVLERGLRAAVVYPLGDTMGALAGRSRQATGWDTGEIARRLAEVDEIASKFESALVDVQLGPVGPQWVSEATLRAVARHSEQTGRRVHMHLLESPRQRQWADTTYPEGLVEWLHGAGLSGAGVCYAHGTQLRPDEMAALALGGCVLSLNASSNMRLCSGTAPIAGARGAGVLVGAGLDGLALADDADYWTELRLLRGLQQAETGRVGPADALINDLAAGGRRALGQAAPLAPAPGRPADFVLLDITGYRHLLLGSAWTPADVALAIGRPGRVAEVWVGGRCAYKRLGPLPAKEAA
jgi:cytosine/adenosine deaminase-related metal-dependent hydrolase